MVVLSGQVHDVDGEFPDDETGISEIGIIQNALVYNPNTVYGLEFDNKKQQLEHVKQVPEKSLLIFFKNKLKYNHVVNNNIDQYYITYPVLTLSKDINFIRNNDNQQHTHNHQYNDDLPIYKELYKLSISMKVKATSSHKFYNFFERNTITDVITASLMINKLDLSELVILSEQIENYFYEWIITFRLVTDIESTTFLNTTDFIEFIYSTLSNKNFEIFFKSNLKEIKSVHEILVNNLSDVHEQDLEHNVINNPDEHIKQDIHRGNENQELVTPHNDKALINSRHPNIGHGLGHPHNQSHEDIELFFTSNINNKLHFEKIRKGDIVIIDYGNKRNVLIPENKNPPYSINNIINLNSELNSSCFCEITDNPIIINNNLKLKVKAPTIIYQKDTKIVLLRNMFINQIDEINYEPLTFNNKCTQPFLHENEWYTKIFFNSPDLKTGKHQSSIGKNKLVFNAIKGNNFNNRYNNLVHTNEVYVSSMKGLSIPFISLEIDTHTNLLIDKNYGITTMLKPCNDNVYESIHHFDHKLDHRFESYLANGFKGSFNINYKSNDKFNNLFWSHDYNDDNYNFNHVQIKGLFFGFGGFIEERYKKESVNGIVNSDIPYKVKHIHDYKNSKLIFVDINNNLKPLNLPYSNIDYNSRYLKNDISYNEVVELISENFSSIIENNINSNSNSIYSLIDNYKIKLSTYGLGGKISTKIIQHTYDLSPNKYIFLVINNFDSIIPQNSKIENAFAKIYLPSSNKKNITDTFIDSEHVFDDYLFSNLSELEVSFVTNEGSLFNFYGNNHSFTLEITEIINKFENIDTRFGNIFI